MERVTLKIQGMSCGHCVASVKKALADLPGIREAKVTLDPPEAVVEYDPKRVTAQAMMKATETEGYPSSIAG